MKRNLGHLPAEKFDAACDRAFGTSYHDHNAKRAGSSGTWPLLEPVGLVPLPEHSVKLDERTGTVIETTIDDTGEYISLSSGVDP